MGRGSALLAHHELAPRWGTRANVLRSSRAVEMSLYVVRAFVPPRDA
jgi:hypothetical protein